MPISSASAQNRTAYDPSLIDKVIPTVAPLARQLASQIVAAHNVNTHLPATSTVPFLRDLAGQVHVKAMLGDAPWQDPSYLNRVKALPLDKNPAHRSIVKAVYDGLKEIPLTDFMRPPRSFTSRPALDSVSEQEAIDLAVATAVARALDGESCSKVRAEFGISQKHVINDLLESAAFYGPIKKRIEQGEPCGQIIEELGIKESEVRMATYIHAINTRAATLLSQGYSCIEAAKQCGIPTTGQYFTMLCELAVDGPAGARVERGENWQKVGKEYGIKGSHEACQRLLMRVVDGPAAEEVLAGRSCAHVAADYEIPVDSAGYVFLQSIAVQGRFDTYTEYMQFELRNRYHHEGSVPGPATRRVQRGESYEQVAAESGIVERELIDQLSRMAVADRSDRGNAWPAV